jgi:putative hydrolase of the HAD superfamily
MGNPSNAAVYAVIFDIGGVLINVDFSPTNAAISQVVKLPPMEIARRLMSHRSLIEFECGRATVEVFHREIEGLLNCSIEFDVFHTAWNSIFKAEIDENIQLLRTLNKRPDCKVGVLSNTNAPHFTYLKQQMKVLNEVEYLYASHEIGCRKPDAESYQHVLNRMNVRPERAVFIDDLPENLEGARRVGMRTIHAVNPGAVKSGLMEMRLL